MHVFAKTKIAKLPTLQKVSRIAEDNSKKVLREQQYKSTVNPDVEVTKEERVSGYMYGKEVVPFSAADEATMGYHPPVAFQVLFFARKKHSE